MDLSVIGLGILGGGEEPRLWAATEAGARAPGMWTEMSGEEGKRRPWVGKSGGPQERQGMGHLGRGQKRNTSGEEPPTLGTREGAKTPTPRLVGGLEKRLGLRKELNGRKSGKVTPLSDYSNWLYLLIMYFIFSVCGGI